MKSMNNETDEVVRLLRLNNRSTIIWLNLPNKSTMKFVTENSLIVVADTVYEDLDGTPVGKSNEKYPAVAKSNPRAAIKLFLDENDSFEMDMSFTGSGGPSLFPDGFLRRLKI